MRTGFVEGHKFVHGVGEVGVQLKDVPVLAFQRPAETGDVRGAQSQLAFALVDVQLACELGHQALDDVGGSIRRAVVHDEHVKVLGQGEYRADHPLDVLLFVVGGYDDQAVAHSGANIAGERS